MLDKMTDYAVETRPCKDCRFFRKLATYPPICKKHLMGVYPHMQVTYKISEGTCFQSFKLVSEGKLFEELESLSEDGKHPVVRLPFHPRLSTDALVGPAYPLRPNIDYDEWERVILKDGAPAWNRKEGA